MHPVKLVSNPPNPFESQYREFLEPPQQIEIAQDERGLRDDGDWVAKLGANFEAGAGQGFGRQGSAGDAGGRIACR